MAIGTPVQLGGNALPAPNTTVVITTAAAAPAGSLIVVFTENGNTAIQTGTVTDTAGNTYIAGTAYLADPGGAATSIQPFYCQGCADLPSGSSITVSWAGGNASIYAQAVAVPGIAASSALDVQGASTNAVGTTPSIATGGLAQSSEIVFGFIGVIGGVSDSFTEAAGFTSNTPVTLASHGALRSGYQIVNSTGSVTYAPTLGTSRGYIANVLSFKGAIAINVSVAEAGNAVDSPSASKGGVFNLSVTEAGDAIDASNGVQPAIFAILRLIDPGPLCAFGLIDPTPVAVASGF